MELQKAAAAAEDLCHTRRGHTAACVAYALINAQLQPALARLAEIRVQSAASDAMYAAVLECLEADEADTEFVDILQTEDQVYYIELNNRALNLFASRCAQAAQSRVASIGKQGIDIPMGTATGIPLFSGTGPMRAYDIPPESNVRTAFSSEFRTAGINQTLHGLCCGWRFNSP
jgi:sporulation protein YunB